MTFVPLCMDADELRDWTRRNASLSPSTRATRPCSDCTPSFAAEMRGEGRCNGEPVLDRSKAKPLDIDLPPEVRVQSATVRVECDSYADAEGYRKYQERRERERQKGRELQERLRAKRESAS